MIFEWNLIFDILVCFLVGNKITFFLEIYSFPGSQLEEDNSKTMALKKNYLETYSRDFRKFLNMLFLIKI